MFLCKSAALSERRASGAQQRGKKMLLFYQEKRRNYLKYSKSFRGEQPLWPISGVDEKEKELIFFLQVKKPR